MPRIKRCETSEVFGQLYANACQMNETNDCTVKAIALLCDTSYEAAHAALKAAGRQDRKGAYVHQQTKAIQALGFKLSYLGNRSIHTRARGYSDIIASYPGVHKNCKSITTHHPRRFPAAWANQPNMLMITRGHAAAFKDGRVHDWSENKALPVVELYAVEKV